MYLILICYEVVWGVPYHAHWVHKARADLVSDQILSKQRTIHLTSKSCCGPRLPSRSAALLCRPQSPHLLRANLLNRSGLCGPEQCPQSDDGTASQQGRQFERSSAAAKGTPQWAPGLVRKLFDKEPDNQHEEALLVAQLAASQLRHALQTCSLVSLESSVVAWADAAMQVTTT